MWFQGWRESNNPQHLVCTNWSEKCFLFLDLLVKTTHLRVIPIHQLCVKLVDKDFAISFHWILCWCITQTYWTRKQKTATTLDTCIPEGGKLSLTKMLGLGEIPRRPVDWDMSRCPFFQLRTTHSTYWVFLDFGGNKYLIWTFFSNPFTKVTQKAASFEGGAQKKTKLCNRPRLPGKLLYHLGFMTWQMW